MSLVPTADLARFVSGLRYEDVPPAIRERARNILLDTLASALAGRRGEEVKQVRALAGALGRSEETGVIGGGRLSLAGATLLNGYLVTAVTVCDVHRPTLYHTTPQVVPPALAIAEREGASGRALLTAIVAGLEVSVRVAPVKNYPAFRARGWHSPGVAGPFGGAAAVGALIGLDAERQCNAFGLAGSQSAGTFAHWGTPTIKFHQCRGALSGLMAALLAQQGFTASREILVHPDGGIYNAYSDGGNPSAVTDGLGERWLLEQIALRLWPAASSLQTVITSLFALIAAHDLKPERVAAVRLALSPTVYDMHGTLAWGDKFKALLSAPYIAAIVLHDRRCWLDQFEAARYGDPVVDAFARERVQVEADASLAGTAAVVEVRTNDGMRYTDRRAAPKGDPTNPLSHADIVAKLRTAADGVLSPDGVERVIELVAHIEDLTNTRELGAALQGAAEADAGPPLTA